MVHLNGVIFLTLISNHIHCGTANAIDNMKEDALEVGLKNIVKCYAIRGFNAVVILVYIQFKILKDRNRVGVSVNIVSWGEHVKQIVRCHRVIEERARCYFAMLPFESLPKMMVAQLLITVTFYINAFVSMKGASKVLPPLTVIEGITLDYNLRFRVMYREFYIPMKEHVMIRVRGQLIL